MTGRPPSDADAFFLVALGRILMMMGAGIGALAIYVYLHPEDLLAVKILGWAIALTPPVWFWARHLRKQATNRLPPGPVGRKP